MFRFTIRDVFWAIVVVGLVLGWGYEHAKHEVIRGLVRKHHPMLYETATGEDIDTNNLKPKNSIQDATAETKP